MRIPAPRLYLGTMTFGWSGQTSSVVDEAVALDMVKTFCAHEKHQQQSSSSSLCYYIDTARIYSGGKTEPIVGSVLQKLSSEGVVQRDQIKVGTKAHPSQEMGLSSAGIESQFQASIDAMGDNSMLEEYYLHQPDTKHDLLESLQCIHKLISDGHVKSFGMSNYHVSEMKRTFELCKEHGLTQPSVYQGLYNPLNRAVEKELIPLLHDNGCSFVAYNPLAAGLLTGKHTSTSVVEAGRFKDNPNYLPRFYTDANFKALALIQKACEIEDGGNMTLIEATFSWLLNHSALTDQDGILLGASSVQQLEQNLNACGKATKSEEDGGLSLSDDMLQAFEEAWKITETEAFPYWRSYSADMPGRDDLDQGASYNAAKKK